MEQAAIIDEELAKLPELYREAIVLCELRGLSRKLAAAELGIREGTLSSRLATAKRKLAARLSARGVTVPATLAAMLAPVSVSAALLEATATAVRGAASGVANAAASAVVKGMLFDQLKMVALTAGLLFAVVCGGLAMTGSPGGSDPAPAPRLVHDPAAKLVEQLGDDDFATRESAAKELSKLGLKAEAALKAGLRSDDPEVRARCATLLSEIRAAARKAALEDLVKNFNPAAEKQPDHPIWKRFKAIAGDTRASRDLFASILKTAEWKRVFEGVDWLRRLDAAEGGPEAAAKQYREAILDVARSYRSLLMPVDGGVPFLVFVWPCDHATETAYLLFFGSYAGTESARPAEVAEAELFSEGERSIHNGRGLQLGLQAKEIAPGKDNAYNETAAMTPGTDRVFAKLLGAWLPRRTDPTILYCGFELAVRHRAADVLPAARAVAADNHRESIAQCAALQAIAQFGTPADVSLFAPLFDDSTELVIPPPQSRRPGVDTFTRSRRLRVYDQAIGLALLLCDQDPFEYGLAYTEKRFRRENGRPVIANYEAEAFGAPDEKTRAAAHTKAKVFLEKRTFDVQLPKAEAEVKKLGLVEVGTADDKHPKLFPISFAGKEGEVTVRSGSAVLIELPQPTNVLLWRMGDFAAFDIGSAEGPEFTHVLCKWTEGKRTWVMYRRPAD